MASKTDAQLKRDVLAELHFDAAVGAIQVGVRVRDGVAMLTGCVRSLAEIDAWHCSSALDPVVANIHQRHTLPSAAVIASGPRMNIDRRQLFWMATGLLVAGPVQALEHSAHLPVIPAKTRSELLTRTVWTQERIAVLRWMWAQDRSASYIARQLGRCTRNSVHRKARQLGLKRPRFGPPDQVRRCGSVAEIEAWLRTTTLTSDQERALLKRYRFATTRPKDCGTRQP